MLYFRSDGRGESRPAAGTRGRNGERKTYRCFPAAATVTRTFTEGAEEDVRLRRGEYLGRPSPKKGEKPFRFPSLFA